MDRIQEIKNKLLKRKIGIFELHKLGKSENISSSDLEAVEDIEYLLAETKKLREELDKAHMQLDSYKTILNGELNTGTAILMQQQAKDAENKFAKIKEERAKYYESLSQIKYEYEQGQDDKVAHRMYQEALSALKETP